MGRFVLTRRQALCLTAGALGAAGAIGPAAGWAQAIPTDRVTVLYRAEGSDALAADDAAIRTAIRQMERVMLRQGFSVMQAPPEVLALMQPGQATLVTFAPDAGFTLVFSATRQVTPSPAQAGANAEVRLSGKVMVGRQIVSAEEGRGFMFAAHAAGGAGSDAAERRAVELAAGRAAEQLARLTAEQLKAVKPEQLQAAGSSAPFSATSPTSSAAPTPTPGPGLAPASATAADAQAPQAPSPATPASPPASLPPGAKRWAVIVAMSDYKAVKAPPQTRWDDLPGPQRDAANLQRTLKGLGYADEQMTVLVNAKATSRSVRDALKRVAGQMGRDDVLVLFISAHGIDKDFTPSGFGMPVLADWEPGNANSIDFFELQSLVRNLAGRVVWINDTCHSGGAAQGSASVVVSSKGLRVVREVKGPDAEAVMESLGPGRDVLILTSSSPSEISWDTAEGGLFTSLLLQAVRQSGGQTPVSQLFRDRVFAQVVEQSKQLCQVKRECARHPQQTPKLAYSGQGNLLRM